MEAKTAQTLQQIQTKTILYYISKQSASCSRTLTRIHLIFYSSPLYMQNYVYILKFVYFKYFNVRRIANTMRPTDEKLVFTIKKMKKNI